MKDNYKKEFARVYSRALKAIREKKTEYNKIALVMAPIFTEENIGEGYIQRVKAIDDEILSDTYNIYVDFETKNPVPSFTQTDSRHRLITMPPHNKYAAKQIEKLVKKVDIVYTHSVMRAMADMSGKYVHRIYRHKNVFYIWDVHGSVPEEFALADNYFEAQNAGRAEELFINTAKLIIVVNNATKKHLENKYNKKLDNTVLLPIFSTEKQGFSVLLEEKSDGYPTAVYAGGLQEWQNIPLMQQTIKKTMEKYKYNMFVSYPDTFVSMWGDEPVGENIFIGRKKPQEVLEEYKKCHYGFVLRDDITVNNVACPTKLIEYLQYGIVPVLKTDKIGDFAEMGMKYISYEDFDNPPGFEEYKEIANANFSVLDKLLDLHEEGVAVLRGKIYE